MAPANPDEGRHPRIDGRQGLDGRTSGRMAHGSDERGVDVAPKGARRGCVLPPHESDGRPKVADVGRLLRTRATPEDLGQVPAEVVRRGDDEPPGGQPRREEGRLVPEPGVAVAEHHEGEAAGRDRDPADAPARVRDREARRDELLQRGRKPVGDVVGGLGPLGHAGLRRRIPHLHEGTVRRQGQGGLAHAEGTRTGETRGAQVRDDRDGVPADDGGPWIRVASRLGLGLGRGLPAYREQGRQHRGDGEASAKAGRAHLLRHRMTTGRGPHHRRGL